MMILVPHLQQMLILLLSFLPRSRYLALRTELDCKIVTIKFFQEELGEIGEDLGLAPPQEISAFKEESDFTSNDLQVGTASIFL